MNGLVVGMACHSGQNLNALHLPESLSLPPIWCLGASSGTGKNGESSSAEKKGTFDSLAATSVYRIGFASLSARFATWMRY